VCFRLAMFGAPASGAGLFGAPASSGAGGLFGAPAAGAGGGLFGAPAAASGGGLFGAPAASSGGGLFGAASSAAGGLFGAPAATSAGGGLFGAPVTSAGGGLFGAPAATSAGGGLFGAPATSGGGGLFGAATSAGGLFGAPAASAGGGLFGAATSTGGGLFGAPSAAGVLFGAATGAGGGLFSAAAASTGGGLFGAPASGAGSGLFGAATSGGGLFGAPTIGAASGQAPNFSQQQMHEAQILCNDLQKHMEDLLPVLQRAAGAGVSMSPSQTSLQHGFVAFTYTPSDNPQTLQQRNSDQCAPQNPVDHAKWMQAVQNNPDPGSVYPEPLVGLPALEGRIQKQQKAMQDCASALEELKGGFGNLKDHLEAQSLQRLEECRQRHRQLSRQLLQVVAATETYATHTGAARRSPHLEAKVEEDFARIEEALRAPSSTRARLEESWAILRGMQAPLSTSSVLSEAEAEKTLRLTASQGELLETLSDEVAQRRRDIDQFESALKRFAAIPSGQKR